LERDLIEDETLLGIKTAADSATKSRDQRPKINLVTIVISALIFLAILAWFDFIQTAFYEVIYPPNVTNQIPASHKLWYAIFISFFVLIVVFLLYYIFNDYLK
jgi:hypothetical protein